VTIITESTEANAGAKPLSFIWLELTGGWRDRGDPLAARPAQLAYVARAAAAWPEPFRLSSVSGRRGAVRTAGN
jgi:hypothetical protein